MGHFFYNDFTSQTIEQNLEVLTKANAKLKLDSELAMKEHRAVVADVERYKQLLEEDRNNALEEIKGLQEKLVAITVTLEANYKLVATVYRVV